MIALTPGNYLLNPIKQSQQPFSTPILENNFEDSHFARKIKKEKKETENTVKVLVSFNHSPDSYTLNPLDNFKPTMVHLF